MPRSVKQCVGCGYRQRLLTFGMPVTRGAMVCKRPAACKKPAAFQPSRTISRQQEAKDRSDANTTSIAISGTTEASTTSFAQKLLNIADDLGAASRALSPLQRDHDASIVSSSASGGNVSWDLLEAVPPQSGSTRCNRQCWPCRLNKQPKKKCSLKSDHGKEIDRRRQFPCCYCETCFAYEWRNCGISSCRDLIQSAR